MKNFFLVLVLGLLFGSMAFADHEGLGIGIVGGGGGGFFRKDSDRERFPIEKYGKKGYGNLGLSLKIPGIPVFWAFYGIFHTHCPGVGLTADFHILDNNLVDKQTSNSDGSYNFKLDYYIGIGGFFHMMKRGFFDIGVRMPIGLSWHIAKPAELFLDVAPCFGLSNWRKNRPFHMGGDVELGLRFWI